MRMIPAINKNTTVLIGTISGLRLCSKYLTMLANRNPPPHKYATTLNKLIKQRNWVHQVLRHPTKALLGKNWAGNQPKYDYTYKYTIISFHKGTINYKVTFFPALL